MPRGSRSIVLLAMSCFCSLRACGAPAEEFTFQREDVMGTSLELRLAADDLEAARSAEARVLREIDRLSRILSGYDEASEFRRWQAGGERPVKASSELFRLLQACDDWRERSGGAFDPRVEAMSSLWTRAASQHRMPTDEETAAARAIMRSPAWRLDPAAGTILRLTACPLSLNAIAKGYIVERACEMAMREGRGVRGVLLNVGGDLRVAGELTGRVGISAPWADSESSEPIALVEVKNRAVATSGSSQRGFSIDGRWYSHILDPRSGLPAEGVLEATVIASQSADADALATICNVLPPEQGLRLVESFPDAECLIIARDGQIARSRGWHRFERPIPADSGEAIAVAALAHGEPSTAVDEARSPQTDTAAAPWGRDLELVVSFEINRPEEAGRGYRRPYVAIWVENKDGFPVRNLTLWVSMGGAGPFQWLPDLKRWYRADQARKQVDKKDMFITIARPTRPPGKYRAIWDGKDDNGKLVPPGEYTIHIDAAREHGTYQNLRKEVTLAARPFTEELGGNVEIKSASIEYRRKAPAKASR